MASLKKHFNFYMKCFFSVSFFMIILTLLYIILLPHKSINFSSEQSDLISTGWSYTSLDGVTTLVDLPVTLPENITDGIRISKVLTQSDNLVNCIARYNVMESCKIYLDDQLLYETPSQGSPHLGKTTGTYWVFQRLPEDYVGKTLTIEVTSPYPNYRVVKNNIYVGTKASILFTLLKKYFWRLLISILFILSGIFNFGFYLLSRNKGKFDISFFFISNAQIWLGGWMFAECHLGQIIITSGIFTVALAFLSSRFAVISFLAYYTCILQGRWRKWNMFLVFTCFIELFTSIILQLLNILDFYQMLPVFLFLTGLVLLSLFGEILWELYFYHSRETKYLFYGTLPFLACATFDLSVLSGAIHGVFGVATIIGILFLTFIMSVYEFKKVIAIMDLAKEARYFQHLAVTDPMTGCSNRIIMKEWIDKNNLLPLEEKKRIIAVVCDVDHLKIINDQSGHQYGDRAICHTADLLRKLFLEYGIICRTGGDEFTCLVSNIQPHNLKRMLQDFLDDVTDINETCKYPYSVSIGYAYYESTLDATIDHTIYRADQKMYQMKHANNKKEIS